VDKAQDMEVVGIQVKIIFQRLLSENYFNSEIAAQKPAAS
jgi:hypothetical protein